MNVNDAFSILNFSGQVTPADIKQAYRKACSLYHPDRNPAGLEMMKLVNLAYEALKDASEQTSTSENNYGAAINEALNVIINFGLTIEICGAWLWVGGNTREYSTILKTTGFKWAPKKQLWYFRPENYKSKNRGNWSIERIRNRYGSDSVEQRRTQGTRRLQAA